MVGPQDTKIYNIVYPYKLCNNQDLKYSIRSIYKNFVGNFKITIIGDIPNWINKNEICCIELDNSDHNVQRQTKINQKILKASELYDEFLLMNDDQYLMREIGIETLKIPRYINQYKGNISLFRQQVLNTIDILKNNSVKNINIFHNMISHCPYFYNSSKIRELQKVIDLAPESENSVVFETAYFNYFYTDFVKPYSFRHAEGFRKGVWGNKMLDYNDCDIFNHDEYGFQCHPEITNMLEAKFNKCKGEI